MTYAKAVELEKMGSIKRLHEEIEVLPSFQKNYRSLERARKFNIAARDALIDLIKFLGPEETQKCIDQMPSIQKTNDPC